MLAQTINDVIARPPTEADIPQIVEFINLCSLQERGTPLVTAESLHSEWKTPNFNPQTDVHTLWTPEGQVIGYAEVWATNTPPMNNYSWLEVNPEYRDGQSGVYLLRWIEARIREVFNRVEEQYQVTNAISAPATSTYLPQLLQAHEYQLVRHFWRMAIELDQPIPQPVLLPAITIRPYDPDTELAAFVAAHDEAFKDHWGHTDQPFDDLIERWNHWRTEQTYDPQLWFVAMDGDEIAAYAACFTHIDEDPLMGWVGVFGVRRPWRKQGLGLALLHHVFRVFQQRGQARVGLGVDAGSLTGATRLYERAGMQRTLQSDRYEKILRPGIDIRTH